MNCKEPIMPNAKYLEDVEKINEIFDKDDDDAGNVALRRELIRRHIMEKKSHLIDYIIQSYSFAEFQHVLKDPTLLKKMMEMLYPHNINDMIIYFQEESEVQQMCCYFGTREDKITEFKAIEDGLTLESIKEIEASGDLKDYISCKYL
jgi:hypothetical protein